MRANVSQMMQNVLKIHDGDPNFPFVTLQKIKEFLGMHLGASTHSPH